MNRLQFFSVLLFLFIAGLFSCSGPAVDTSTGRDFVVLLDNSKSTPAHEDSLNKAFVRDFIGQLRFNDAIAVLLISEASFSNPQVVLEERLPYDDHPLQPDFLRERENLVSEWQQVARRLKLQAQKTDIVGALFFAQQILAQTQGQSWILFLSDMRQSSDVLNIENDKLIDVTRRLNEFESSGLPDLDGVNIVCLGVHTHGRKITPAYYNSLIEFWQQAFGRMGARLVTFQPGRNLDWMPAY
jgi:hypothetical protein